jgi:hypothetical protein
VARGRVGKAETRKAKFATKVKLGDKTRGLGSLAPRAFRMTAVFPAHDESRTEQSTLCTSRNGAGTVKIKRSQLGMDVQDAADVVVHDVGDEGEEEDQADLDEAFLEGQAEIAAADAFKSEK